MPDESVTHSCEPLLKGQTSTRGAGDGGRWPVAGGQFKNSNGMKVGGFVHLDETDSTGHSVGTESVFQRSCAAVSALKPKLARKGQKMVDKGTSQSCQLETCKDQLNPHVFNWGLHVHIILVAGLKSWHQSTSNAVVSTVFHQFPPLSTDFHQGKKSTMVMVETTRMEEQRPLRCLMKV